MRKPPKPEPDGTVKPRRAARVPVVADISVQYPYAGGDRCVLCGALLSRYNPYILCNADVARIHQDTDTWRDLAVQDLLDQRRPLNPRYRKPTNLNVSLLESAGAPSSRPRHHRQDGHY